MIAGMATALSGQAPPPPAFTPDQCRVLRQVGVDIRDICPPPKKTIRGKPFRDQRR